MCARVAKRPDIGSDSLNLCGGQRRAALRWHRRAVLLRLRHADRDGVVDCREAAVAPQPFAAGEVGPEGGSLAVSSVAACAGGARDLTLEDALAQRNLLLCRAGR